jgi:hypothetical protein
MATYKEIYGTNVEVLASDPSNPVEGQIWYNSTSQTLKGYALVAGSWATAGPLNTARQGPGGAGTQTSALAFGGFSTAATGATESYNGTAWTTSPNSLNTARFETSGCGATNTAALAVGGYTGTAYTGATETWNGTSWTEVNDLNTARGLLGTVGINTAALAFGGETPAVTANTETWNGTTWTEINNLNTARDGLGGAGIQAAALAFGGFSTTPTGVTESWNGSSWTEVNDLNTVRQLLTGEGTNTAALAFGGGPPSVANTENWNGTSWTEVNDLNTARFLLAGAGTNTAGLAFGGGVPTVTAATEEWSGPAVQTVNITVS